MALRANVSELHDNITGQLPLNRQVVLRRVLRPHVRLEITVKQHGPEAGPILGRTRRWAQDAIKRIRIDGTTLRDKRSVQERRGKIRAASERRLGAELFEHQLLHRVIEEPPTGTDAGLAIAAKNLPQ